MDAGTHRPVMGSVSQAGRRKRQRQRPLDRMRLRMIGERELLGCWRQVHLILNIRISEAPQVMSQERQRHETRMEPAAIAVDGFVQLAPVRAIELLLEES